MYFVVAKILGFFALPSNLMVAAGLAGLATLATRFAKLGRVAVASSLVLLAGFGWLPLGNALILPLEQRFPAAASVTAPDGIVVLGGSFDTIVSAARGEPALNEAAERVTSIADLARRFPAARILFSGGEATLAYKGATEAQLASELFESFGIARNRLLLESRSRDTSENATFSKALADPKPGEHWLLVTSAYHMPRAMGAFRRVGFPVEAYPVDFRTRGIDDLLRPFSNIGDGLRRTDTAVREWMGLLVYWLTGRSRELFPGPAEPHDCRASKADCRDGASSVSRTPG